MTQHMKIQAKPPKKSGGPKNYIFCLYTIVYEGDGQSHVKIFEVANAKTSSHIAQSIHLWIYVKTKGAVYHMLIQSIIHLPFYPHIQHSFEPLCARMILVLVFNHQWSIHNIFPSAILCGRHFFPFQNRRIAKAFLLLCD